MVVGPTAKAAGFGKSSSDLNGNDKPAAEVNFNNGGNNAFSVLLRDI